MGLFPRCINLTSIPVNLQIKHLQKLAELSFESTAYLDGSLDGMMETVERWLDDEEGFAIWIHGPVGVGKSILTHHLARTLRTGGCLGGLVHLSVSSKCSPSFLIQGIARELAVLHPCCRAAITDEAGKRGTSPQTRMMSFSNIISAIPSTPSEHLLHLFSL